MDLGQVARINEQFTTIALAWQHLHQHSRARVVQRVPTVGHS